MNLTKKLLSAAILLAPLSAFATPGTEITAGTDLSSSFTPAANATSTWSQDFYTTSTDSALVAVAFSSEFTFGPKTHGSELTFIELEKAGVVVDVANIASSGTSVVAYTGTFADTIALSPNVAYELVVGYTSSANPYSISSDINVIAAVPEASEFAMMLAGLPLLALAARKSKKA